MKNVILRVIKITGEKKIMTEYGIRFITTVEVEYDTPGTFLIEVWGRKPFIAKPDDMIHVKRLLEKEDETGFMADDFLEDNVSVVERA